MSRTEPDPPRIASEKRDQPWSSIWGLPGVVMVLLTLFALFGISELGREFEDRHRSEEWKTVPGRVIMDVGTGDGVSQARANRDGTWTTDQFPGGTKAFVVYEWQGEEVGVSSPRPFFVRPDAEVKVSIPPEEGLTAVVRFPDFHVRIWWNLGWILPLAAGPWILIRWMDRRSITAEA